MVTAAASVGLQRRVTDVLLEFLDAEVASLESEARPLLDELAAIIDSGGKRLRPRFCYWGHRSAGGDDNEQIIRIAAALELVHTFALIHDDVMDRSPLRRSRLSTFRALEELAAGVPHRGDPRKFGTSAAILTGLLGFVLADRLFFNSGFAPDVVSRAADRYDRMRTKAIAGQYLDLLAAHRGEADEATARRIASLKSGSYTVAEPLAIGALCAGADAGVLSMLEAYGRPLGEAFQIRDDVLGVFGDPDQTGKDRDGDLREGKQTVLLAKARALADDSERSFLDATIGCATLDGNDADRVRAVIESTGALRETTKLIGSLAAQAKDSIDAGTIGSEAARALLDLADEVALRNA